MIDGVLADPVLSDYLMQMTDHDRTTAGHMFMVSMLAVLLGREVFGPDRDTLKALASAGMLHDLGKLSLPSEVLKKRAPLTRDEVHLVQQHPIESVRMVDGDPHVTAPVRQMIMQHHERMDGRGYPLGLTGADLLPGSRVLSVVDSFHALIGRRPYRSPLSPADANRVLLKQSGTQFDSDLLAHWIVLFDRTCAEPLDLPVLSGPAQYDDIASKHEHSPHPPAPKIIGPRQRRFPCRANTMVRCIYAGRLRDVSPAPSEFSALVQDVSRGGVCVRTSFPMYRGEIVYVRIDSGPSVVWLRSTVAWCRLRHNRGYRIGLRFDHRMSKEDVRSPAVVTSMSTRDRCSTPRRQSTAGPPDLPMPDKPCS
jgi:hypothetical protein